MKVRVPAVGFLLFALSATASDQLSQADVLKRNSQVIGSLPKSASTSYVRDLLGPPISRERSFKDIRSEDYGKVNLAMATLDELYGHLKQPEGFEEGPVYERWVYPTDHAVISHIRL